MNFKVVFNLDGSGIVYDPNTPINLDALLHWCLTPYHRNKHGLSRDEAPDDIPLPLLKYQVNGDWVWQASALFPEGNTIETLQYWRKRLRQNRIELTTGNPNLQNGVYRDYNMPMPILHVSQMVAYASGNRKEVKRILKKIKFLGKKRAYGKGAITSIDVFETEENFSIEKDNRVMRWLPCKNGTRLVRPRPPYWNPNGRVKCLEIGELYS